MSLESGYWYVKDLNSRNGIKVNGSRVQEKRIDPGDVLAIAKHAYEVNYSPAENGAVGPPPPDSSDYDIFQKSLLERAGLQKGGTSGDKDRTGSVEPNKPRSPTADPYEAFRYDLLKDGSTDPKPRRRNDVV